MSSETKIKKNEKKNQEACLSFPGMQASGSCPALLDPSKFFFLVVAYGVCFRSLAVLNVLGDLHFFFFFILAGQGAALQVDQSKPCSV